ncbi:MAG: carboxymuconolactone decarboxylase family protein [Acidobacteriota bacterium]
MKPRLEYQKVAPDGVRAMLGLEAYLEKSGLDRKLVYLVILRASQINGCAYCIDMHSKDLRAEGESEQRLYLLDGWREAPFYSDRERAALAWAEAVTKLPDREVPDEVYNQARAQFSEKELVDLTFALVAINGWNRLNIAFRTVAGSYQPKAARQGSAS